MFNRLSPSAVKIRAVGVALSLVMMLTQFLAGYMMHEVTGAPVSVVGLLDTTLSTLLGLVIGQVVLTFFLHDGVESRRAWIAAGAGLVLYTIADTCMVTLIEHKSLFPLSRGLLFFGIRLTANVLWMYGVWLGVAILLLSQEEVAEERRKSLLLERAQFETRLSFLESQINPHFLFNALNTVASLIVLDRSGDAREAVVHLGHLLRRSLSGEGSPLASLSEEITAARAYLTIEKLRFGDRLDVDWQIGKGLDWVAMPRFSLQPLVENVVRHAVAHADTTIHARITAETRRDGHVEIAVWNEAIPASNADRPSQGCGVGLKNLEQRLDLLFAGEASLTARPGPDGSFEARIVLPVARLAEAAE